MCVCVCVSAGGVGSSVDMIAVSLLCRLLVALARYSDSPPFVQCCLFCTGVVRRCVYWTAVVVVDGF